MRFYASRERTTFPSQMCLGCKHSPDLSSRGGASICLATMDRWMVSSPKKKDSKDKRMIIWGVAYCGDYKYDPLVFTQQLPVFKYYLHTPQIIMYATTVNEIDLNVMASAFSRANKIFRISWNKTNPETL